MNTSRMVPIVLVLVLVVAGGYYASKKVPSTEETPLGLATTTPGIATTTTATTTPKAPNFGVGYEQNRPVAKPAPVLTGAIVVPPVFSEVDAQTVRTEMQKRIDILKKDKGAYATWLELAVYRKLINDYKGAAEIWDYTKELRPADFVSFYNLADLYAYFDRDLVKSEANFKKAIEVGKDRPELYRAFADFYLTVYKDTIRAKAVLKAGIAANPENSAELTAYRNSL